MATVCGEQVTPTPLCVTWIWSGPRGGGGALQLGVLRATLAGWPQEGRLPELRAALAAIHLAPASGTQ